MPDRFGSFEELSEHFEEGRDFEISSIEVRGGRVAILAPHGGKIEKGTSEIAIRVAQKDYSLYLFEGKMATDNRDLHVTSHRFFEKRGDALLAHCEFALGIHGRADRHDSNTLYLGGRDAELVELLRSHLLTAGFGAITCGHPFPAQERTNICNRCTSGGGAQIELPLTLRLRLLNDSAEMNCLVGAIRGALCARMIGEPDT
ncbi:poly-gamma-glutamate hydrolase family protein [Rhizobium ruizarguesonis]